MKRAMNIRSLCRRGGTATPHLSSAPRQQSKCEHGMPFPECFLSALMARVDMYVADDLPFGLLIPVESS